MDRSEGILRRFSYKSAEGKFPKTGSNASMRSSEPALASDVQDSIRCSRFFLQRFNRLLRGEDHKV